jgi:cytosine/creatinine deaminase
VQSRDIGNGIYDLLVRNARLGVKDELIDLGVCDGIFTHIEEKIAGAAKRELDVAGRLVVPPFVEAHMHLDSALTVGRPRYNASGTLFEGIQIWNELRSQLTFDEFKQNALEVIRWQVVQGTLFQRCHVDVSDPQLTALHALLEVREEMRDLCEIQLVAFPQNGVLSNPSGESSLRRALELGCEVIGGIPHQELTYEQGIASIKMVFDLAQTFDVDIDCHCDETDDPHSRFVETMAAETLRRNWNGRVTASHCTAMAAYNGAYLFKLLCLLEQAQMTIIANPFVNALLQGRFDNPPKRRGMAPIKDLLASNINVALGCDSIMDAWLPLGTGDMIPVAQMAIFMGHLSGYEEINRVLDLVTVNGAKALGLGDRYGIGIGRRADFVVLDAPSVSETLRLLPARLHVFRAGREIAATMPNHSVLFHREGERPQEVTFRTSI